MLAGWMLYCVGISILVALAAGAWERARAEAAGTLRWGWFAGMLAIPVVALLPSLVSRQTHVWADGVGAATGDMAGTEVVLGPPTVGGTGFPTEWMGILDAVTPLAVFLWALATVVLLIQLLAQYAWLRRAMDRWPRQIMAGREVLVSEEVGPGVLGLVRGAAIVPQWCLGLPPEDQTLVVTHEDEHLKRMDNLLLAASRAVVIALPWNLPLWWMNRRLRVAVELDCDARVTNRYPDHRRRYAELLVATASRPVRSRSLRPREPAPLMLLAESSAPLHRRIVMLTQSNPRPSFRRALALGVVAGLLLLTAALVPGPDLRAMAGPNEVAPEEPIDLAEAGPVQADTPVFTPFTVAPEVRNRAVVSRTLEREYPPLLRNAGVGGTVLVYFFINDEGEVEQLRVHESSGHEALDAAALRVGATFEFSPAMNRDRRVPVWIQIPITFTTRDGDAAIAGTMPSVTVRGVPGTTEANAEAAQARAAQARTAQAEANLAQAAREVQARVAAESRREASPPERSAQEAEPGPVFTPFTVAPEVRNRPEVSRALEQEYPRMLRDAGVGGTALLYFYVDAEGNVRDVRLHESSGHASLDAAALRVGAVFRFSPAMNREQRVPVWIQIPVSFTTR